VITWEARADLIIVGTGVAGLTAALTARSLGLRTLVVTKGGAGDGNTRWAQGGVAVVLPDQHDDGDSVDRHVADTVVAGAGLCDEAAAAAIIADGPAAVTRLRALGATFDPGANGQLARTREGGHSAFRVVHAGGDATGAEVERALLSATDVPMLERHTAVDIVRTPAGAVAGLLVLDAQGTPGLLAAPAVLLATGGLGQLYQATSNPEVATGDGIALALRAGALIADLEFVQFHPTVLYTGSGARGRCPLVTEAVRGEGAVLVDASGERVMLGVHPLADLAPRDVVAAAITRRMATEPGGIGDHVFLDATHLDESTFRRRFPTVHAACLSVGVDPTVDPIPVAPAAHFACGGVMSTVDGRTTVTGLYAAGEVARTGLHGANRLASNSLLEGLVVGARAANAVAADLAAGALADPRLAACPTLPTAPVAERDVLQRVMSRYAAIGRDGEGLAVVGSVLDVSAVNRPLRTREDVEDAALTLTARALLAGACDRTESRGCHVRTDFPAVDDVSWRHSLKIRLTPSGQPVLTGRALLRSAA
jgi:L-aspartate oxidase